MESYSEWYGLGQRFSTTSAVKDKIQCGMNQRSSAWTVVLHVDLLSSSETYSLICIAKVFQLQLDWKHKQYDVFDQ